MKLVIVESPAKSKTIGHYLGEDYTVEASVGHIRDLATSGKGGLGVDVENNFKPTYTINKDKKDVVNKLKRLAKKADEVILATDPDREGEAIAYHLANVLKLPIETTKRLEFHEITKDSISNAILNPRTIDMDLVHSQETRRIIDRIIGFKISSLIKNKIRSTSAGRVQSVTLKLICDHEKEILDFVPVEYWKVNPIIKAFGDEIELELYRLDGEKVELNSEAEATAVLDKLSKTCEIKDIKVTTKKITAQPPFRTSTLQQEAFSKYGFKTKETTALAQKLYEGIELNNETTGLITYMRTDSTKLSDTFVEKAKDYIIETYGEEYYKGVQIKATKKVNMAQDAHEAIRPTSVKRTPASIKKYLTDHEYKLYKLIYERTLASLMSEKVNESYQIIFKSNDVSLKYDQSKTIFKGYDILQKEKEKNPFYDFEIGQSYEFITVNKTQNFTKAPARYSEGRVVKLMEDEGIGRPSTYASTISTLVTRKYITSEKGILTPTEQGIKTSNVLTKYFPDLMNTEYTADMENNLDLISTGESDELQILTNFYNPFIEHFEVVKEKMYKDATVYTGAICPKCGGRLVIRTSRFGEFIGCENYPDCDYIEKPEKKPAEEVGRLCPNCGHPLVYRYNKRTGVKFIACSNFPKCKYQESIDDEPSEVRICPECGALLVKKTSKKGVFYGCSNYPKCKHMEPLVKKEEK